jgi:hypothetical protein
MPVTVICEYGHKTELEDISNIRKCPFPDYDCPSTKLTYVAGSLKESRSTLGRNRGGVTQMTFKEEGRMEKLDKQYGNKF